MSSGCGWRRWSPGLESICKCIEQAVAGSTRGGLLVWGLGKGLTTLRDKKPACYEMLCRMKLLYTLRRILIIPYFTQNEAH
jgi:membrane protein YqaA with SNARE-associated domain